MRKTHKEFMEIVKLVVSPPELTKKALSDEHPSDLRAIEKRDRLYVKSEVQDGN